MNPLVVAGIGTGVGKTFISAILAEALEADYWKPVQAGNLDFTDTDTVHALISNPISYFYPETYRLASPMSPHAAAAIDGVEIDLQKLSIPGTSKKLVIELAGGLMVPLNKQLLNIDLVETWKLPVILVSQHYLGSINHTLLSVDVLKGRGIPLAGIIFNGQTNMASEEIILAYSGAPCLARIKQEKEISKETVKEYAEKFRKHILDYLS